MKIKTSYIITFIAVALVVAEVALALLSWLLHALGDTASVHSMLSGEGIRWFCSNIVDIIAQRPLAWIVLLAMSIGCFYRSISQRGSYGHRSGALLAVLVLIAYVGIILALILPSHGVLLSATGQLYPSPFSDSVVPMISLGLIISSAVYGFHVHSFRSLEGLTESLLFGIRKSAPVLFIYVLLMQFYESLRYVFC